MTAACAECDTGTATIDATIVFGDGGALVEICNDCRDVLLTTRCARCGHRKGPRSRTDYIHIHGKTSVPLCDRCRETLIRRQNDERPPTYEEMLLADSPGGCR